MTNEPTTSHPIAQWSDDEETPMKPADTTRPEPTETQTRLGAEAHSARQRHKKASIRLSLLEAIMIAAPVVLILAGVMVITSWPAPLGMVLVGAGIIGLFIAVDSSARRSIGPWARARATSEDTAWDAVAAMGAFIAAGGLTTISDELIDKWIDAHDREADGAAFTTAARTRTMTASERARREVIRIHQRRNQDKMHDELRARAERHPAPNRQARP